MLNQSTLKIDKYSHDFNTQGYVVIDDLLDIQLVKKWNDDLQEKPDKYWFQIIKNQELERDFNLVHEKEEISLNHNKAMVDYQNGQFCFSFKRINESIEPGDIISHIIAHLSSNNFRYILSQIGKRKIEKMSVFYINRFDSGDFLTTHSDSGNSMGIVVNLTKDWNPNFGGITFLLDREKKDINDVLMPKLGRVLVFDIMKNNIPHFVSMVTSNNVFKRLAVVARYD